MVLPQLSKHRLAAKALIAEGWQAWQSGDENVLADNAVVVLASAHHFTDVPAPLIQFMVADACVKLACDALRNALELSADPDALAARISARLTEDDPPLSTFARALRFEKLWCHDFCQRLYIPGKRRGSWGLHWNAMSALRPEDDFEDPPDPIPSPEELMTTLKPHGAQGYEETIQEINTFFDSAIEWSEAPVRDAGRAAEIERIPQETKNAIAKSLMPSLVRAGALHDRTVAHRRATHLLVHLFAYHAQHRRFPRTLAQLETPNLAELRIDPFGGKHFVYKRTGRTFSLHSVGQDMTDDGGKHHAKWGQDGAGGDFVFWPVQSIENYRWGFLTPDGRTVYPPKPNPAEPVNYIAWINETFWSDSPDNAEREYFAAFEAVRTMDGADAPQLGQKALDGVDMDHMGEALSGPWTGHADVEAWLVANRSALAKFRAATKKPKCFFRLSLALPGQPEPPPGDDPRWDNLTVGVMLPGLSAQRAISKALIAEGWRAWAAGDQDKLLDNALVILRSAHHLEQNVTLIARLVAVACEALTHGVVRKAFSLANEPGALATAFAPRLTRADPPPPPKSWPVNFEYMTQGDIAQRLFVPGDEPGTWTVPEQPLLMFMDEVQNHDLSDRAGIARFASRLTAIGFDDTMSEAKLHIERLTAWFDQPRHDPERGEEIEHDIVNTKNPFIGTFFPSLSRCRVLCMRGEAERRATHLIVHLFAHREKNGGFPTSLRWLEAPNLAEIRIDPFSGKDFKYRRTGDSFTLYTVAGNLKDDGGRHAKWNSEDDDFVFWPVQE